MTDILANQDGDKAVEAVTDIDRGLPTEGVMTMYVESMSNLSGVYSALEGIVREAFDPNTVTSDSRFKISLYLEITDLIKREGEEEPEKADFIEPFTIELDNQTVETKVQCFRFIEKHISRNHIINNWKHVPMKFDQERFSSLSDCQLAVNLYLECAPQFSGGNLIRRRCGRVFIPLDSILSAANQEGYKASYGLVSDSRDIVAYLNCTLNYAKAAHERGNQIVEDLKTDMIQRTENLRHNKVYIRICELLFLKPIVSSLRKNAKKSSLKPINLRIRLLLGKSEVKSVEFAIPAKLGEVFRLKFDGHENSDLFVECLDLSDIERYITDKSVLEKYFNLRTSTQTFHSLPPFTVELCQFEEYTVVHEIGKFDFNLVDLLSQQGKWENRGLLNYRAYIPLLPGASKGETTETEIVRLGIDFTILKTNKIKNKHTLEDIGRLLLDSRLRSFKQVEPLLLSSPTATHHFVSEARFTVPAVTKLLKQEFSLSNTEIAEIIDLLGKTPEEDEVDFYKVTTAPFMHGLTMLSDESSALKLTSEDMLRVS